MRFGVCTHMDRLPGSVAELDYIESSVQQVLVPTEDEAEFERRLALWRQPGYPLPVANALFPGEMKTIGPNADHDRIDAWMRTACRRAETAGIGLIVYGGGGARKVPNGYGLERGKQDFIAELRRFGDIARPHGVTIVVEPLRLEETNLANTVTETAEFVRAAAHASVRMLADTYHMAAQRETPEAIGGARDVIVHAHCAEVEGRLPVGTNEDQRPYFAALKQCHIAGGVSIEARWDDFNADLPRALRDLRRQWEQA